MKKNITYVEASKFDAICFELGAKCKTQAGFVKVMGAAGRNMYIARTKQVGRIDISGFTFAGTGVRDLRGDSFGAVEQQLNFSLPEADILTNFRTVLNHMLQLEARQVEKKVPVKKAAERKASGKKAAGKKPMITSVAELVAASKARAEKLALIKKVAAEKGVEVSPEVAVAAADLAVLPNA